MNDKSLRDLLRRETLKEGIPPLSGTKGYGVEEV